MSFMEDPPDIDLGDGHKLWFTAHKPNRELNPGYADIPDTDRWGAIVSHGECYSGITFRGEAQALLAARGVFSDHALWDVLSWQPLTLAPSLLCRLCGDHGFIRAGRWERA